MFKIGLIIPMQITGCLDTEEEFINRGNLTQFHEIKISSNNTILSREEIPLISSLYVFNDFKNSIYTTTLHYNFLDYGSHDFSSIPKYG